MWKQLLLKLPLVRAPSFRVVKKTFLTLSSAQLLNIDLPDVKEDFVQDLDLSNLRFSSEVKSACSKSDEAIRELIQTLNACIEEICEQYQHCVAKQIEITVTGMNVDPIGKHWDDLTKYRVEANDLKLEFEKYRMLVERIGQIIYNQTFSSVIAGSEASDVVTSDYESLKNLVEQKNEENRFWDSKLLDVNAKSILTGVY